MDTPCWSWGRILDSVGAGKNGPSCAEAMERKKHLEQKLGKQP